MARGPAKCLPYGIYIKLTGEELKKELKENPKSDGFVIKMCIQCKSEGMAKKCIDEYIKIGRLDAGREYKTGRISA